MKARFLLSTLTEFPTLKDPQGNLFPEIALAGRSNVGKSSLINHLLNHQVARTSATPGKTQLLNFFSIDEKFLLVDLPGYGYAKAPKEEVAKWSEAIDTYINSRPMLRLILLLIDCRRGPNDEDRALMAWAKHKQIPLLVILTKTDKLSRAELKTLEKTEPHAIAYTIMNNHSKHILEKKIEQILWG